MLITLTGIFNDTDKFTIDSTWIKNIHENSVLGSTMVIGDGKPVSKTIIFNFDETKHQANHKCTIVHYYKKRDLYLRVKETEEEIRRMYEG